MEERTGWQGQNESQIVGEDKEKSQTCWCCRDQQRACRMAQTSAKKLEHTGPAEKEKSGLSATERAVGRNTGAAFAKKKRNRAVCPEYQIMRGRESKWVRAAPWRVRGGSERDHGEERLDFTVKEGKIPRRKGRARNKSLPRRSRRKHKRVGGRKSSPGQSEGSWFHS